MDIHPQPVITKDNVEIQVDGIMWVRPTVDAKAIRLVNEAAQQYFVGNAQALKQMEMIETSLRENAKIVITEHGISPTLLLGSLPVSVSSEKGK